MRKLITASLIVLASTGTAHAFGDEVLKQILKNSGKGAVKEGLRESRPARGTSSEIFPPDHDCYRWRSKQFSTDRLVNESSRSLCYIEEYNYLLDNPKAKFDSQYRDFKPEKVTCWFDNCPSRLEASKACSWWKYQAVKTNYIRGCREERRTNQFLGLQEGSVKKRFRY